MYKLAPSLLAADFSALGSSVEAVSGAHYLHFDVMDGHFVPNLSFGIPVMTSLRPLAKQIFDVHLMMKEPLPLLERFANAGADILTVHLEAVQDISACINRIYTLNKIPSIAIKPATDVRDVLPYIEQVRMVLILSVEPGFGGQRLMPETLRKSEWLAGYISKHRLDIDIEMDGGIYLSNLREVMDAGVNVVVAGSAVFNKSPEITRENTCAFLKVFSQYTQARQL